jgi:hypothetical protein
MGLLQIVSDIKVVAVMGLLQIVSDVMLIANF